MNTLWWWLSAPGALIWLCVLGLPWRAWSTRESLDTEGAAPDLDLSNVTVLIPARNEAAVIGRTLAALSAQGRNLNAIVIDDQSEDGTAAVAAQAAGRLRLHVVRGVPLPEGWAGKLWALEQGRRLARTNLILLLDADIELKPGLVARLLEFKRRHGLQFVSLMAQLSMTGFWEKLLLPAYVYFFKLLYPFALSNSASRFVAAAAGGCILADTRALEDAGAFASLRGALIDDCTLARRVKDAGHRTWIGLTHSARSLRAGASLAALHRMVARTAFTQLLYSGTLLVLATAALAAAYLAPVAGLWVSDPAARVLAGASLAGMALSYWPTLRYYGRSPAWVLALPLIGALYLAMTWSSALGYWSGVRSNWKGRIYAK